MACGGRAEGRTEQRVGRVMRPHEGKPESWVIDFRDSHHYFLQSQAKKRAIGLSEVGHNRQKTRINIGRNACLFNAKKSENNYCAFVGDVW
jgi:superfamily II DNA or RNA helicase